MNQLALRRSSGARGLRVAWGVGITTGWGETEVFMEVSSRRLAIVQHRNPPARGLLSLISLLSAFLLTGIKRNQADGLSRGETEVFMEVSSRRLAIVQHRNLPARGLLSLISLLSAFLLTGIKRNQAETDLRQQTR